MHPGSGVASSSNPLISQLLWINHWDTPWKAQTGVSYRVWSNWVVSLINKLLSSFKYHWDIWGTMGTTIIELHPNSWASCTITFFKMATMTGISQYRRASVSLHIWPQLLIITHLVKISLYLLQNIVTNFWPGIKTVVITKIRNTSLLGLSFSMYEHFT